VNLTRFARIVLILARFAGQLKRPEFIPDELVKGVFAPNSHDRARVTPAKRGRGGQPDTSGDPGEPTPAERRASMRLKRNASNGSSASISRPAQPVAGPCASSPVSKARRWSRRFSPTWMRKHQRLKPRSARPAARPPARAVRLTGMSQPQWPAAATPEARLRCWLAGGVTSRPRMRPRTGPRRGFEPSHAISGLFAGPSGGGLPLTTHARNGSHRRKSFLYSAR